MKGTFRLFNLAPQYTVSETRKSDDHKTARTILKVDNKLALSKGR
jgi:hypothetical protein